MNKYLLAYLLIIATVIIIMQQFLTEIKPTDKTKYTSTKKNSAYTIIPARDYQIEFVEDSMLIFDGNRYVGTIPMWDNSPLDSLLKKDNE